MDKFYCVLNVKCIGEFKYCDNNLIVNLASLWPGAFCQFNYRWMEESVLCIFMRPLKVGGVGLIFMNFHLHCLLIRFLLVFEKCLMLF